ESEALDRRPVAPGFSLGHEEIFYTPDLSLGYQDHPSLGYQAASEAPGFSLGYEETAAPPQPQLIIGSNTTWTLAGSPYVITSSVLVSTGVTLTVEPGVVVKFDDNLGMQVDGTLIARGTASQPITFTSSRITPAPGAWGFIKLTDSSGDATFDGSGNYLSGSILQYAVVEYAGATGSGAVWLERAAPFVDHSTIRNNSQSGIYAYNSVNLKIANNTIFGNTATFGGGIYAYNSTVTITINTIVSNTTSSGFGGGGGINAYYSTATISGNTISGNTAAGAGGGIYANNGTTTITNNTISGNTASHTGGGILSPGGTVTISGNTIVSNTAAGFGGGGGISATNGGTVTISGNTIFGNTATFGGGIIADYGSTVTISSNTISGNTASSGGGIYAYHGSTATISGNRVVGNIAPNYAGIYSGTTVVTNSIVANQATSGSSGYGSVYVSSGSAFSCNTVVSNTAVTWAGVAIGGSPAALGNNNLYGNTSYEAYNDSSSAISATNNWWGTTDTGAIDAEIYDFFDDIAKGVVSYSPYLTAPAPCAPPAPPTGLGAIPGSGSLRLSWNANPEGDMAGYRVYWDTDAGFPYANVITAGNTTAYTLTSLTNGITYFVAVTAYDTAGDESWYSGEVSALPSIITTGGTVTGRVDAQGRANDGGVLITVVGSLFTSTTAADGIFTLVGIPSGTYTVTASMPGYLYAQRAGVAVSDGTVTALSGVRLLGGDADRDGDIDIADLVLLGANFGLPVPPADTRADGNGDGLVNIYDIVLIGINLSRAAPSPWP
ncbi:MAG: right-handed parallel beta-helix repeat-containing protein, partial [Chloroflexi bacterium]|nr:right-handed parallel beta-helix repeat-containing protein [Chloroflexota bacterium]